MEFIFATWLLKKPRFQTKCQRKNILPYRQNETDRISVYSSVSCPHVWLDRSPWLAIVSARRCGPAGGTVVNNVSVPVITEFLSDCSSASYKYTRPLHCLQSSTQSAASTTTSGNRPSNGFSLHGLLGPCHRFAVCGHHGEREVHGDAVDSGARHVLRRRDSSGDHGYVLPYSTLLAAHIYPWHLSFLLRAGGVV